MPSLNARSPAILCFPGYFTGQVQSHYRQTGGSRRIVLFPERFPERRSWKTPGKVFADVDFSLNHAEMLRLVYGVFLSKARSFGRENESVSSIWEKKQHPSGEKRQHPPNKNALALCLLRLCLWLKGIMGNAQQTVYCVFQTGNARRRKLREDSRYCRRSPVKLQI